MTAILSRAGYRDLLSVARRYARNGIDAEDLLQDALAAAIAAGREAGPANAAWLAGAMRNIARMNARTAMRRRRREHQAFELAPSAYTTPASPGTQLLEGLSPSLRIVALLAIAGHHRAEIRHLLGISDAALRQRIAGLRRSLKYAGGGRSEEYSGLDSGLAFGAIRRALLPLVRTRFAAFASHDPDGHLVAFAICRPTAHKSPPGGNQQGGNRKRSKQCCPDRASETSATTSPTSIVPKPSTAM